MVLEEGTSVAGTLDRGEDGLLRQFCQFLPGPPPWLADAPLDREPPGAQINVRDREVIADEKEPGRRDPAAHAIQRRLAVLRCGGDDLTLLYHQTLPTS